jgi:hypothetical protein
MSCWIAVADQSPPEGEAFWTCEAGLPEIVLKRPRMCHGEGFLSDFTHWCLVAKPSDPVPDAPTVPLDDLLRLLIKGMDGREVRDLEMGMPNQWKVDGVPVIRQLRRHLVVK